MPEINGKHVRKLVIACDAGMGSSVMLAGQLRKALKKEPVEVTHTPVDSIPDDADVVLTHVGLAERARRGAPKAVIIPFELYIGDPAVNQVITAIKSGGVVSA